LLKKHYGSTLNEYSALLCTMAYKRGHADGYRKAKGGKKSTRIKAEDVVAFVVGEIGWEATDNQVVETFDVLSLGGGYEAGYFRETGSFRGTGYFAG
jgi:hypothetical protein